jgi:carbon monoxide dehydrogenase subunit G
MTLDESLEGVDFAMRRLDDPRVAAVVHSVEVARSPEDVFAYLDDLERRSEWQSNLVSSKRETDGPTRVGTRVTDLRRVPGRTQSVTYEITEHDSPRKFAFRGVNGPVRPVGSVTVEPAGEGGSRVTIELDFEGNGLVGPIFASLARGQARKQVPEDQRRLKDRLESEPGPNAA